MDYVYVQEMHDYMRSFVFGSGSFVPASGPESLGLLEHKLVYCSIDSGWSGARRLKQVP